MDDSLESLLEKATNPKNRYEDWEFIMAFCDKVNGEAEGPQVALRIIVPKIQSTNEKVGLLALTLLEACVKNCGKRFHQELGKFRFLNEMIRSISPKYLGERTPTAVQKKIKDLLYSWKLGLPHEPKIQEAYEMLKREGLVFDESVGPDKTLEPAQTKPKVRLLEEPKQSKMLQKLLASKNPDDLRAANRLIREMVRRDDKRMQKLQKRLDELELVQNNVKLLSELLSHYKPEAGEQERLLIDELYNSIEKMRPTLFRMASELKQDEEGMAEILQTNETVIRVLDRYKSIFGEPPPSTTASSSTTTNGTPSSSATSTATGGSGTTVTSSSGAAGNIGEGATAAAAGGAVGATASSKQDDVLIDLLDLDLGPPSSSVGGGGAVGGGNLASGSGPNLGSLLDDFESLNLPPVASSAQNSMPLDFSLLTSTVQQPAPPQQPKPQQQQTTGGGGGGGFPLLPPPPSSIIPPSQSSPFAAAFPNLQSSAGSPSVTAGVSPKTPQQQQQPNVASSPGSALQGFGLDVFGLGSPSLTASTPPSSSANQQGSPLLGAKFGTGIGGLQPGVGGMGLQQQPQQTGMGMGLQQPGGMGMGMGQPLQQPAMGMGLQQPTQPSADPLAVLNDLTVSLDSIQPGTLPPMQVMNKNSVAVSFHFAKNSPASGVGVIIVSIVSTSPTPVTNVQFQAAVPKTMRVKLQPPTKVEMAAYNPIQPPASISQVMLLANPSKTKIRLRYRISYNQGGQEVAEMGEAADFPFGF